jgi:predicted amidohydrolase
MVPFSLFAAAIVMNAIPRAANPPTVPARYSAFTRSSDIGGLPAGWATWSPRAEISPAFKVEPATGRAGKGALSIRGNGNAAAVGSWRTEVGGIIPGRAYRFTAWYRTSGHVDRQRSVLARLDWLDAKGERARPPDYALEDERQGEWTRFSHQAVAPDGATRVRIELELAWAPEGTVYWDDISLTEDAAPRDRRVKVVTVAHRPRGTSGPAASVEEFCKVAESAAGAKPDVICLPEGITLAGTNKSYADVAESLPGPTMKRLGELAKSLNAWVVAGIYERVGPAIYNTAVLIDRKGALAGKYRKTHLPREEVEGGLTPGDSYPTFETDFGRVGLMICWDVQFPEPARALALQGAEVLLLPIWGGSEILAKARAIENHVFLVSASYDMKTFVVDPSGAVLAEASTGSPTAIAEMALDRKIVQPWLGDMKARTWKERRGDIPLPARH